MLIWLFYVPFGIIILKHILYYVIMYLCEFELHGLLLAIVAHSVWNWYTVIEGEWGVIPLGLITLAVVVLPVMGMYKVGKEGLE